MAKDDLNCTCGGLPDHWPSKDCFRKLQARVLELEKQIDEQCRLNGAGGSRELALITKVKDLEAALAIANKIPPPAEAYAQGWSAAQEEGYPQKLGLYHMEQIAGLKEENARLQEKLQVYSEQGVRDNERIERLRKVVDAAGELLELFGQSYHYTKQRNAYDEALRELDVSHTKQTEQKVQNEKQSELDANQNDHIDGSEYGNNPHWSEDDPSRE